MREQPAPENKPASTEVAEAVEDTFKAYLQAVKAAPTLAGLDSAVTGPGRPAKGTPEYRQTEQVYLARKAELQAQVLGAA